MNGKYFLYNRLVLTVSHSEGELFCIAPIIKQVLPGPHPHGRYCDFDLHCSKYSGTVIKLQRFLCGFEALRDSLPSRSHTALST